LKLWKKLPVGLVAAAAVVAVATGPANAAARPATDGHGTGVRANTVALNTTSSNTVSPNGKVKAFTVKTTSEVLANVTSVPSAVKPLDVWYCVDGFGITGRNGDYVTAEMQYTGTHYAELRTRSAVFDIWQQFGMCRDQNNGLTYLWSEDNGLYVTAEMNYTGSSYAMLRARSNVVDIWQYFYW
jgi:hypothetical protein